MAKQKRLNLAAMTNQHRILVTWIMINAGLPYIDRIIKIKIIYPTFTSGMIAFFAIILLNLLAFQKHRMVLVYTIYFNAIGILMIGEVTIVIAFYSYLYFILPHQYLLL